MTTDEFNKKLDAKLQAILKEDKPLFFAVRSAMALQSKRIWIDGKNKSGSIIGEYSKKEVYIDPIKIALNSTRSLPIFPLLGKDGLPAKKNGKKNKTGYFKNYLTFKKSIGRNRTKSTVDLFLTSTLAQNWSNVEVVDPKGTSKAQATKLSAHKYIVSLREGNIEKVARYGVQNIFGLSTVEKGKFLAVIQFELAKALR